MSAALPQTSISSPLLQIAESCLHPDPMERPGLHVVRQQLFELRQRAADSEETSRGSSLPETFPALPRSVSIVCGLGALAFSTSRS
jgi:hypothetical protein